MEEATSNPTILTVIVSLGTLALGWFGKAIVNSQNKKADVKIAQISSETKEVEELKKELIDFAEEMELIKDKLEHANDELREKDKTIAEYKSMLQHFKVLFMLIYKQLIKKLEADQDSLIILEEVKKIFDEYAS